MMLINMFTIDGLYANDSIGTLKGLVQRLVKFVYNFFLSQTVIHQQLMKPSLSRTIIFKLIVQGIELHGAFEERENKQKTAKF